MSIKLMSSVWEIETLSATHKLVMLALADWANDDGLCWPSINRLSVKTSLTERGVQKAIRALEDMGLVRRDEVVGKGNKYWLKAPLNDVHPRTTFTPPPNVVHPTPEPRSPNTSKTHQLNTKSIMALPDWLPVDAWNGWLEMRKVRKKPMTDRAVTRALNKLDSMRLAGQDIAEVLDRSTMNGWTDLYEIKGANHNGNQIRKSDGVDAALDTMLGLGSPARAADRRPVDAIGADVKGAIART